MRRIVAVIRKWNRWRKRQWYVWRAREYPFIANEIRKGHHDHWIFGDEPRSHRIPHWIFGDKEDD